MVKIIKTKQIIWLNTAWYLSLAQSMNEKGITIGMNKLLSWFLEQHDPEEIVTKYLEAHKNDIESALPEEVIKQLKIMNEKEDKRY